MNLNINTASNVPKYRQIADGLTRLIESGALKVGEKLPSIDIVSRDNNIAKETVVQAYKHLKSNGIILSSKKKGFYVQTNITNQQWRVMLLFNIMSPSKEVIYHSIINSLKEKAHVELFFHNYNFEMFENIIRSKADMFHYFIVMPHYSPTATDVLKIIPPERLIILDTPLVRPIPGSSSVHQDFREDVFDALSSEKKRLQKYKKIVLLSDGDHNVASAILSGIEKFGAQNGIAVQGVGKVTPGMLKAGTLFITLTDDLLINCIELQQHLGLKLGKDIGIISYNENPLKRILSGGIATLSSNFKQMGITAASCIRDKQTRVVRNPFSLTRRGSF